MAGKKISKNHVVVFEDQNGNVIKTAFVAHGQAAVPPEMPEKAGESEHYELLFDGWDGEYDHVQGNLILKAVYRQAPKKYLVMYFHENGRMLGMESVPYGSPAKADILPVRESTEEYDYIFSGWSCPLDEIKGDTSAKAVFEARKKSFAVSFFDEDGNLLQEENVPYGEAAHPPADVKKEQDAVYQYRFAGWDCDIGRITGPMYVRAVFDHIFIDYTVSFYEEETLIRTDHHHFGDEIIYPKLKKKGYDLVWDKEPAHVGASLEIHASWRFSNPKGKMIRQGNGCYEIVNPSVTNGSVRCLWYTDEKALSISLPDRVKLGDYYYRIEEIGPDAFSACIRMERLRLPDTVTAVRDWSLANCRRLEQVILGKGLHSIGNCAFAGNAHLKDIVLDGKNIRKCGRRAFEKLKAPVRLYVNGQWAGRADHLFGRALRCGQAEICTK